MIGAITTLGKARCLLGMKPDRQPSTTARERAESVGWTWIGEERRAADTKVAPVAWAVRAGVGRVEAGEAGGSARAVRLDENRPGAREAAGRAAVAASRRQ